MTALAGMICEEPGVYRIAPDRLTQMRSECLNSVETPPYQPVSADAYAKLTQPHDARLELAAAKREWAAQTPGYLKVRSYVSDRIVISCGFDLSTPQPRRSGGARFFRVSQGERALARHRETQKRFFIGGRLRRLPSKTRFTPFMSNQIRDGCTIIERRKGGKGWFFTLTWPGSLPEGYEVGSAGSGFIINRLTSFFRNRCLDGHFAYVWELQARGAPHLHFMLRTGTNETQRAFRKEVQRQWRKILCQVSDDSGVDVFARAGGGTWREDDTKPIVYLKRLHKDHANYMAKYVSKSRSKSGDGCTWFPGRWGALSYPLGRKVREERLNYSVHTDSGRHAAHMTTMLVDAIQPLCKPAMYVRDFETFGSSTVSLDVPLGTARAFALAIASVLATGEWSELASLANLVNLR